jgi:hypothetical protein
MERNERQLDVPDPKIDKGKKRKTEDDDNGGDEVRTQCLNGTGSRYKKRVNLDLHNKRSIITIKNKDNLCLARALVVAIAT